MFFLLVEVRESKDDKRSDPCGDIDGVIETPPSASMSPGAVLPADARGLGNRHEPLELREPVYDAEAVRWYRLAADQGYAAAQGNLGLMYGNGTGVPQGLRAGAHMAQPRGLTTDG